MNLSDRLRSETRDAHDRIEAAVRIGTPGFTLADYIDYLATTYAFVGPCEAALAALDLTSVLPDVEERAKALLLETDLRQLGVPVGAIAAPTELPNLTTLSDAAGYLYVLEGSSLGSQILVKHVRATLGDGVPAAYLAGYGTYTGSMWRSFKTSIDAAAAAKTVDSERVIVAARSTFAALTACYGANRSLLP